MKSIIVLPESFIGKAYEALKRVVNKSGADEKFLFFKYSEQTAAVSNCLENYNEFKQLLRDRALQYEEIPESSLDEYFFLNKNKKEVYLTPSELTSQIITSASLLGYKGNLFVYGVSQYEAEISNLKSCVNVFKTNQHRGTSSLDKTPLDYEHSKGSIAHFTINDKNFEVKLNGRGGSVANQGAEGYIQYVDDDFVIKIWDGVFPKKKYEIEKMEQIIRLKDKHPNIAFPLAFVYNSDDEPIGYVMRRIYGRAISFGQIHTLENPEIYVKQLLEQLIWLQVRGFLHRDINHNVLVNTDKKEAYIIDVESAQLKGFMSSVKTADSQNALPEMYNSNTAFFNTIDISYSALIALTSVFCSHKEVFGPWNEKTGFATLKPKGIKGIGKSSPSIARLICKAHTNGYPVSLIRQLEGLKLFNFMELLSDKNFMLGKFDDCNEAEEEVDDEVAGGTINYESTKTPTRFYEKSTLKSEENYVKTKPFEIERASAIVGEFDGTSKPMIVDDSYQKIRVDRPGDKNQKGVFAKIWEWIINFLVEHFIDGTVPYGKSNIEILKAFIKSGKWKKPACTSLFAIGTIIVLLIAIFQL